MAVARGLCSLSLGSLFGHLGPLHSTAIVPVVSVPRKQINMDDIFVTLFYEKQSQCPAQVQREETYTPHFG